MFDPLSLLSRVNITLGTLASMLISMGGCLGTVASPGCTIDTRNRGEVGFSYSTNLSFFHQAAQTAPDPASIEVSVPSLEEYFHAKTEQIGPPAPTEVVGTGIIITETVPPPS